MLPLRSALVLAALVLAPRSLPPSDAPIRGFLPASVRAQRDWEAKFQALPDPDSLREYMRVLSARPHHLGSAGDSVNAAWLLQRLTSWGLDARIETFHVLFPTPRERVVALVAPRRFTAALREPPLKADPTSAQQAEQLPTYNAYSPDGDVTAPLVFVNYGIPEDYARLERLGVSVKGAIVIAKYGRSWRGIKPKLAAEHGAVGCLIYSDPGDDGYHAGDTYPKGPFRPRQGVQRGSILDMPLYRRRSAHPGRGRDPRCQAAGPRERADLAHHSRAAALLGRRAAVAGRHRRPASRPRPGQAGCRSPITSGPARRGST